MDQEMWSRQGPLDALAVHVSYKTIDKFGGVV